MMRKRKIIGIIGLVLILVIVLFYVVRIRPMVKEYKKIAYDKLANIDEDTFAKLENTKVTSTKKFLKFQNMYKMDILQ